jgi:hypothetical protein
MCEFCPRSLVFPYKQSLGSDLFIVLIDLDLRRSFALGLQQNPAAITEMAIPLIGLS